MYASELAQLAARVADRYPNDPDALRVAEYAAQVERDHAPRCSECGGPLEGWAGEHHSPQCTVPNR